MSSSALSAQANDFWCWKVGVPPDRLLELRDVVTRGVLVGTKIGWSGGRSVAAGIPSSNANGRAGAM